jgi:hypothetical protein
VPSFLSYECGAGGIGCVRVRVNDGPTSCRLPNQATSTVPGRVSRSPGLGALGYLGFVATSATLGGTNRQACAAAMLPGGWVGASFGESRLDENEWPHGLALLDPSTTTGTTPFYGGAQADGSEENGWHVVLPAQVGCAAGGLVTATPVYDLTSSNVALRYVVFGGNLYALRTSGVFCAFVGLPVTSTAGALSTTMCLTHTLIGAPSASTWNDVDLYSDTVLFLAAGTTALSRCTRASAAATMWTCTSAATFAAAVSYVGAAPEQGVVFAAGPGGVFAYSQATGVALAGGAAVAEPDAATRFFGVAGALAQAPMAGAGPIGCSASPTPSATRSSSRTPSETRTATRSATVPPTPSITPSQTRSATVSPRNTRSSSTTPSRTRTSSKSGNGGGGDRRLGGELLGVDAAAERALAAVAEAGARAAVRAAFSVGAAHLPACGVSGEPAGTFLVLLPPNLPPADWEVVDGVAFRQVPGMQGQGLRDAAFTAGGSAAWLLGSSHGSVALVEAASGQLLRAVMPPAGVAAEQLRMLAVISEPANETGHVYRLAVLTSAALYELTVPLDAASAAAWEVVALAPAGERFVSVAVAGRALVIPTTTVSPSPMPIFLSGGEAAALAIASGAAAASCGFACWIYFIASACCTALVCAIVARRMWVARAAAKHPVRAERGSGSAARRAREMTANRSAARKARAMTANPLRAARISPPSTPTLGEGKDHVPQ